MLCKKIQWLLTTFWVGSLWTIGYVAVPTLFATLPDKNMAGSLAGQLFFVEACITIACAFLLTGVSWHQSRRVSRLVLAMLLCTVVGYFFLHPLLADMHDPSQIYSLQPRHFELWHGLASFIYLIQSILGAFLILREIGPKKTR